MSRCAYGINAHKPADYAAKGLAEACRERDCSILCALLLAKPEAGARAWSSNHPLFGLAKARSASLISKSQTFIADDTILSRFESLSYVTMRHLKTQVFASELLASVLPEAFNVLFPIAVENKSGLPAEIAIRLGYIADELSEQELYQLPPDTQSLSLKALQDLVEICNVCHVSGRYSNELH